jgi:acetyltransferase-like isoleucine patch superfamily enzyme
MLKISEKAYISKLADIEESIRGTDIIIDDNIYIDSFVKIKPVGGIGNIYIGKNSYINSGSVIYSGNGVKIGENVLIAPNCTIAPVNHQFKKRELLIVQQRFQPSRGGILIEDDVWIGANSVILDGAVLRKGCIIGANSLVRSEIESYSLNVGSPARKVGYRE